MKKLLAVLLAAGLHAQTGFLQRYRSQSVPPPDFANSARLESLLRAGNLYVSLQDAIALALENNLDIEIERYGPRIADTELRRAEAGEVTGAQPAGPAVPNLDPVLTGQLDWTHRSQPLTNAFSTGTNTLVTSSRLTNFGIQQGFLTGTTVSLGWDNNWLEQNSGRADFNPSTTANLNLTFRQRLLQGFGLALNSRYIRIARNSRAISDLGFQQQVIAAVSSVAAMYWDLVGLGEEAKVKRQTVELAARLLEDNKQRVELGSLAAIEVARSRAEVARAQQELTIAETALRQQESLLKDALIRSGVATGLLGSVRIVPTDTLPVPDLRRVEPIQDLLASAARERPELAQSGLQIQSVQLGLKGAKSALLPSLDLVATLQNNALAGDVNALPTPSVQGSTLAPRPRDVTAVDPFFLGGYGTVASQLLSRNFPDYAVGFQLTIPLRNRAAQAEMVRGQLALRQEEIRRRQLEKKVELEVDRALIALDQARARYDAAAEFRKYQEETTRAEQDRYELGASTTFFVIQAQRDLAQARSAEIAAMAAYSKAAIELDRAAGRTLAANHIVVEEARSGKVSRPPDPLPVLR